MYIQSSTPSKHDTKENMLALYSAPIIAIIARPSKSSRCFVAGHITLRSRRRGQPPSVPRSSVASVHPATCVGNTRGGRGCPRKNLSSCTVIHLTSGACNSEVHITDGISTTSEHNQIGKDEGSRAEVGVRDNESGSEPNAPETICERGVAESGPMPAVEQSHATHDGLTTM